MENGFMNKVIGLVLVLVIGASLVGGLLVPSIQAVTATETTFENEGYYTMDKVATDAAFTLEWDYTEPTVIDIDGVKIDLTNAGLTSGKSYTVFGSDNFVVRLVWGSAPYCQCFTPSAFHQASATTNSVFTATVSNGAITVVSTDPNYTTPATIDLTDKAYCINPKGDGAFVMKKDAESAYIETTTDIVVLDGITVLPESSIGIYADGTINGDLNAVVFRGDATYDVTFSDWTYDTSDVSGYINLVNLEKVVFTATQNDTDYTVTYSYFIVPAEVTAEKTQHMDAGQIAIFGVVSLLGIVLLITIAASAVRSKY